MEENDEDLAILARQLKQRPSYARIISWEMSKNDSGLQDNQCSTDAGQQDNSTDGVGHECYAQAGLEEESLGAPSYADVPSTEEESDVSAEEDFPPTVNASDLAVGCKSTMEVIPVKRGKHKRRKRKCQRRLQSFEYEAPYSHVDDIDFGSSFNGVVEQAFQPQAVMYSDVTLFNRPVPTLVGICLNVMSRSQCQKVFQSPLLGSLVREHHKNRSLQCLQLSWVHHALAFYEECTKKHLLYKGCFMTRRSSSGEFSIERIRSTIWSYHVRNCEPPTGQGTDLLALTSAQELITLCHDRSTYISIMHAFSAFVVAMDTLISPLPNIDPDDITDRTMMKAVSRCKQVLQKRYPVMVKCLFPQCLPYVWWGRGDVDRAERAFQHLLKNFLKEHKEEEQEDVALYLNELGRMFGLAGVPHKAVKYYLAARDFALAVKQLASSEFYINLQTNILIASVSDSGVLTEYKAKYSKAAWDKVLADMKVTREGRANYGRYFFSQICVHSAIHTDVSKHKHFEKMQDTGMAEYFSALLHAMSGDNLPSLVAYRTFVNRYAVIQAMQRRQYMPGSGLNLDEAEERRGEFNPWRPLLNAVQKQGAPIQPLKMVWRTKLGYPLLRSENFKSGHEVCEVSPAEGHLWLTEDGYLTGDLQMLAPAISPVRLDLYTGMLQYSSYQHTTLKALKDTFVGTNYLSPPCTVQLYENLSQQHPYTVDLLMSNTLVQNYYPKDYPLHVGVEVSHPCQCALLQRSTKSYPQQKVKVDLRKIVRNEAKKMVLAMAKKYHERMAKEREYMYSLQWLQDMIEQVELFHKNNWNFHFDLMSNRVWLNHEKKLGRKPLKFPCHRQYQDIRLKGRDKQNFKQKGHWPFVALKPWLFEMTVHQYMVCGHVLYFIFKVDIDDTAKHILLVFNLSCAESFRAPLVIASEAMEWSFCYPDPTDGHNVYQHPCQVLMYQHMADDPLSNFADDVCRVYTFNENGNVIHTKAMQKGHLDPGIEKWDYSCCRLSMAHALTTGFFGIYTGKKKTRVVMEKEAYSVKGPVLPKVHATAQLGQVVLVCTDSGMTAINQDIKQVPWVPHNVKLPLCLSEDQLYVSAPWNRSLRVLTSAQQTSTLISLHGSVGRALVALDNHILVLEWHTKPDCFVDFLHIVFTMEFAGWPTEAYFITDAVGFLVTASIHEPEDLFYTENLYHVNYRGEILGILPCLGVPPHSLISKYLPANEELHAKYPGLGYDTAGWYLFLRDGNGGICCIRLQN